MKIGQLKERLNALKQACPLRKQTVEVVIGSKKYFIAMTEKRPDSILFSVTRKSYHMMNHQEFEQKIADTREDALCLFLNLDSGQEPVPATGAHLSRDYLEINTDEATTAAQAPANK